jgi:3-dehydroquinate synthase
MTVGRSREEVRVDLGPRSYPIVVGEDVLDEVGPRLADAGFRGRAAVVTSERVGALYLERVQKSLAAAGLASVAIEIPDGEEHKNLAWLAVVYDRLIEARIERSWPVVALGGGVIGDLTGFAAATLLRGLPVVQLPTTLLAQVDAAIGGKTGVNHALGKNLIGAFHQPRFVLADVGTLRTLPRRELVGGLAEVIKYGIIRDAALFARLEGRLGELLGAHPERLVPVVAACCRIKAAVVAKDEHETSGERAVLNFGHTIGHGVEMLTEYRDFLHGEAVAIGMVAAARISRRLDLCDAATVERVTRVLGEAGLPTELPAGIKPSALAVAIQTDKKSSGGRIRFVALEAIGRTRLVELSAQEIAGQL